VVVVEFDNGKLKEVYPAYCTFSEESETKGFGALTKHMEERMGTLMKDVQEAQQ
jgi:hypothetical protein